MSSNLKNIETEVFNNAVEVFDFGKCVLCQESSTKKLVDSTKIGRQSLCDNLKKFFDFETSSVPRHICDAFNSGREKIELLVCNDDIKYHKTCKDRYHPQKLDYLKQSSISNKRKTENIETSNLSKRSRNNDGINVVRYCCLFCNSSDTLENFSTITKLGTVEKLYEHAVQVKDEDVISKFVDKKLPNENSKYHTECYNRFLRTKGSRDTTEGELCTPNYKSMYDTFFNELVMKINEDFLKASVEPVVYKLSELSQIIAKKLNELGYENPFIHTTRLKEQLIKHIPDLRYATIGKEVRLFFNKDVHKFLEKSLNSVELSDSEILLKALNILRSSMFENQPIFDGSFNTNFTAENTVSNTLITFVQMLLEPRASSHKAENNSEKSSSVAVNIAQLIKFNSLKYRKQNVDTKQNRHAVVKEQPLPVYLGLLLHSSNQRYLVDKVNQLGLCVSYNRVLEIETAIASKICELYSSEEVVCPPNLLPNKFTTAAMDNIDHNPVSTSAKYAFHGTGMSIIQHYDDPHEESSNDYIVLEKSDFLRRGSSSLPASYYDITPLPSSKAGEIHLPTMNWETEITSSNPLQFVTKWLNSSKNALVDGSLEKIVSWSAYNSRLPNEEASKFMSSSTMLPLLKDDINSPAVVRHVMDIVISIIRKLNPGQVPVITGDLPVYIIAKEIQLNYPSEYGEDKILILQGGLHIEMSFIAVIGTWLEESGWDEVLTKAGLTTPTRALGILKSSHVKRSRYAHEVSLTALNMLLYEKFKSETNHIDDDNEENNYHAWIEEKCQVSPQYQFWVRTMKLEAMLLQFIKSTREANFEQYVADLEKMCPWYFVTHHHKYAHWMPIFIRTLKQLPTQHPEVYENFKKGHFTSRKTNKRFSCISHDQLHEQNNKLVKGNRTIINSLDDESRLAKWLISGPEIARLIAQYTKLNSLEEENANHHEDTVAFQTRFSHHVKDLVKAFQEFNPFSTNDLTSIGNTKRVIKNEKTIKFVMEASKIGDEKYKKYVEDKLIFCKASVHETISAIHPPAFKIPKPKSLNKDREKLASAQNDSNTFCKMFIACESRDGDVLQFFKHENSRFPPSISEFGKLRSSGHEADIVDCLTNDINVTLQQPTNITTLIIDASLLVNSLSPRSIATVEEYCSNVFNQHIQAEFKTYTRVDIVFDVYNDYSFHSIRRNSRQDVNYDFLIYNNTKIPSNFSKFLADLKVKNQFFNILALNLIKQFQADRIELYCTYKDKVLTTSCQTVESISPTSQEESKTRMFLHVKHAVECGHRNITIRTEDCDVIAVYAFAYLLPQIEELWVDYGTKKHRKLIPIHNIYDTHKDKSDILPFFHTFTGVKVKTSSFFGIGKSKAWKSWMKFREIDEIFHFMSQNPLEKIYDRKLEAIEKFLMRTYDKSEEYSTLHDCRRILFSIKNRDIANVPPTENALKLHILRAIFASYNWLQCLKRDVPLLDPTEYGWMKCNNGYDPIWITNSATHQLEIIKSCKCKGEKCRANCPCTKRNFKCTKLCYRQNKC